MSGFLGLRRHFKGGWYLVLGTTRDSTNGPNEGRRLVLYIALHDLSLHSRVTSEFLAPACRRDGCKMCPPRFMTLGAFRRWKLRGAMCGT